MFDIGYSKYTMIYTHVTQDGPQAIVTPLTRARAAMQRLKDENAKFPEQAPSLLQVLADGFTRLRTKLATYLAPPAAPPLPQNTGEFLN